MKTALALSLILTAGIAHSAPEARAEPQPSNPPSNDEPDDDGGFDDTDGDDDPPCVR